MSIPRREPPEEELTKHHNPFEIHPSDLISFKFDGIIHSEESQSQIFSTYVETAIIDLLAGRNLSVIVFGTSSSGKSFTMRGGEGKRRGLVLRGAELLLTNSKKKQGSFEIKVSVIAVCGERIFDLITNSHDRSEVTIRKITDLHAILHQALKHRKLIGKDMKEKLHFIVTMRVYNKTSLISQGDFVELAASEHAKKDKYISGAFNSLSNILRKATGNWYDNALTSYLRNTLDVYNPFNPSQAIILCCVYPIVEHFKDARTLIQYVSRMKESVDIVRASNEHVRETKLNKSLNESSNLKAQIEKIRES